MEEFRIAHSQVVNEKRKKLIIPVKLEDIPADMLDDDLKLYMNRFTYAEVDENQIDRFRKKLHFAMPKYPLWKAINFYVHCFRVTLL